MRSHFIRTLKESILFTDWMVGDSPEMRQLGICGVDEIRGRIKEYLVKHDIFDGSTEEGRADMERCLSASGEVR